jgi:hypothetical protein
MKMKERYRKEEIFQTHKGEQNSKVTSLSLLLPTTRVLLPPNTNPQALGLSLPYSAFCKFAFDNWDCNNCLVQARGNAEFSFPQQTNKRELESCYVKVLKPR